MPENKLYPPEGLRPPSSFTLQSLREAMEQNTVLEDRVLRCDAGHNLLLSLGGIQARIPREEVLSPWISGAQWDIAVLSRVGKPACFLVTALRADEKGAPTALLSRRAVQERAMDFFLEHLRPGSVVTAVVTHLESFGAFLDIGCGIVAMLPIIAGDLMTGFNSLAIGGTSVIIVVGVALETVKALEAQMLMRHYKGFLD